jgi:hypothetical protein
MKREHVAMLCVALTAIAVGAELGFLLAWLAFH